MNHRPADIATVKQAIADGNRIMHELMVATGLSKSHVHNLVKLLIATGDVVETDDPKPNPRGRPAKVYDLAERITTPKVKAEPAIVDPITAALFRRSG